MRQKPLAGKICLVTGATRGIGAAIATELGSLGGVVIGTATSQTGADAIGARLQEQGHTGAGKVLDVTNAEQLNEVITDIVNEFGPVSVLVNNAGITRDNLMLRMKEEEWDAIMDTNLKAVFRTSKACLRGMTRARFGRIINISSVVGTTGNAGQANYATAKAGLIGFSRSLAQEVASRNITVNVVSPGFIQTDMTDALDDKTREILMAKIPLARLGTPADVAGVVGFLASPTANYMTGTVLHVNGGMFMG